MDITLSVEMKANSGVNLGDVADNMVTINDILELRSSWWKYKLTNALKFRKA